jgi:hypothetical protein
MLNGLDASRQRLDEGLSRRQQMSLFAGKKITRLVELILLRMFDDQRFQFCFPTDETDLTSVSISGIYVSYCI